PELVAGLHEVWDEVAEQDDGQSHDHPSLYVHDTKLAGGRCTVGTVPGVSRPRASPALEQAAGDLLRDEREGAVVTPVAVDVEVAAAQALVAEAELLHHAQTRRVLRPDVDLQPVQAELGEAVVPGQGHGGGCHAPTRDV